MDVTYLEPHVGLKHVIRNYWFSNNVNAAEDTITLYSLLSDGAPGIILQHQQGSSAVFEMNGASLPISFVYGQSTLPCVNYIRDCPFIFGINLQPTALKVLFNLKSFELTNTIEDLESLLSQRINDRFLHTQNPVSLCEYFNDFFLKRLENDSFDWMVQRSIGFIFNRNIEIKTSSLSTLLNISERQLQRRFREYVGLSVDSYRRIIRFQKCIHLLRTNTNLKLSELCYDLGYADQSHFNREFKVLSGVTPKEFIRMNGFEGYKEPFIHQFFEPLRILKH